MAFYIPFQKPVNIPFNEKQTNLAKMNKTFFISSFLLHLLYTIFAKTFLLTMKKLILLLSIVSLALAACSEDIEPKTEELIENEPFENEVVVPVPHLSAPEFEIGRAHV